MMRLSMFLITLVTHKHFIELDRLHVRLKFDIVLQLRRGNAAEAELDLDVRFQLEDAIENRRADVVAVPAGTDAVPRLKQQCALVTAERNVASVHDGRTVLITGRQMTS